MFERKPVWMNARRNCVHKTGPAALTRSDREVTATILKMTYGYDVEPHQEDPLVDLADQVITQFSAAGVPGAWMVDTIPACWSTMVSSTT